MSANALKRGKATALSAPEEELTPQQRGGKKRTASVAKKLKDMLEVIKIEIASNKGVYPYGRLSQAAIAIRAGVHPTSLHTKKGKTAGDEVHAFVTAYNKPPEDSSEKPKKRKSLNERLQDKNFEFEGLLQAHQLTNLKLQQMKAERDEEREKNKALEHQVAKLRAQLANRVQPKTEPEDQQPPKRATKRKGEPAPKPSTSAKVVPMRRKKPRL